MQPRFETKTGSTTLENTIGTIKIPVSSPILVQSEPEDAFQILEEVVSLQKSQGFNRRCEKCK